MNKSQTQKMPPYFDRYINLVEDIDVVEALEKYSPAFLEKEKTLRLCGENLLQQLARNNQLLNFTCPLTYCTKF